MAASEVRSDGRQPPARRSSGRTRREIAEEALTDLDPTTSFLYTPHTVTALLTGIAALVYYSGSLSPPERPIDAEEAEALSAFNCKAGIAAGVLMFLGYSICQGPPTLMVRPHPIIWRLVHGILIVYLVALVWLLFQDVTDARLSLKHLYPELGVDLGERAYGGDCRLFTPEKANKMSNLWDTLFDEFVLAHTFGWMAEALVLRHYGMLFTVSVAFELMELTFQHWLPNFNECWWDSWILDVLICNNIGIFLGMALVKYFKSKEYNWTGISQRKTVAGKVARGLGQFTPYEFQNIEWAWLSGPTRLIQCLIPCVMNLQFKVVAFFLKFILWVPPTNPLNTYRLLIWFLMSLPATLEYYEYISTESEEVTKLGVFAWLTLAVTVVEILICIKFGRGMFPAPWPERVLWFWGVAGALFAGLMTIWYLRIFMRTKQRANKTD